MYQTDVSKLMLQVMRVPPAVLWREILRVDGSDMRWGPGHTDVTNLRLARAQE
jgi:hypothetical protein